MAKTYSKQDEKMIKDLMNTLYDHHKLSGGSFFTDFVHGFTLPFKQFGHLLSLIPEVGPALASVVTPVAEAIDTAVPGHRYANISDAFSGKPIKGTGRGRGRRKIPKEIKIDVNIEDPTKRDKVFTETAKQLIDEENKNVVGKRPRGRPKKKQGGGLFDPLAKLAEKFVKDHPNPNSFKKVPKTAPVVGSGKRKSMKGGRKGIGQLFREGLKKTVERKKLREREQAKSIKQFRAKNAEAPVESMKGGNILKDIGRGVQYIFDPGKLIVEHTKPKQGRGRPKGSKNKK